MANKSGDAGNNKILGTAAADVLNGLEGNDTLLGAGGKDSLIGGLGADSLDGGADNDTLSGGEGDDILLGQSGNDKLMGDSGNDTLDGGAGKDTLDGGTGNDSMTGGAGNDLYMVNSITDKVIETELLGSIDTVQSTVTFVLPNLVEFLVLQGVDDINGTGNALNNKITGSKADNVLTGLDGQDTLIGGGGADTLNGGAGIDSLVGGAGDDTYQVSSTEDKIVELALGGGMADKILTSVDFSLPDNVEVLNLDGTANLSGDGNNQANILNGNSGANELNGAAGNDTILGNDGDDTLAGGAGDDSLNGGAGNDVVTYNGNINGYQLTFDSEGNSWIIKDIDSSNGDDGTDTLIGIESAQFPNEIKNLTQAPPQNVPVLAIADMQIIEGNSGTSNVVTVTVTLSAAATQAVTVNYATRDGTAKSGSDYTATTGTLTFAVGETSKVIHVPVSGDADVEPNETFNIALNAPTNATLGSSNAVVTITNDDDGSTPTVVFDGWDFVLTSDGDDVVATDQNDRIDGVEGDDKINGAGGNDSLIGGVGHDTLLGFTGNDTLNGGDGNDSLEGGDGDDSLDGGNGNDSLNSGDGDNSLFGSGGDDALRGGTGHDSLSGGDGNDDLRDSSYDSAGGNTLDGGMGNDYLEGSGLLLGGDGNDTLYNSGAGYSDAGGTYHYSIDTLNGGAGDDNIGVYAYSGQGAIIIAGDGNDTVTGSYYIDDKFSGDAGNDELHGRSGKDTLSGGVGDDKVYGEDGDDKLYGNSGKDSMDGGSGIDTLSGDAGADTLTGGSEDDVFVFANGDSGVGIGLRDIITDFDSLSTVEVIDLSAVSANVLTFMGSSAFTGAGQVRYIPDFAQKATVIQINLNADLAPDMEIQLTGIKALTAADFVL